MHQHHLLIPRDNNRMHSNLLNPYIGLTASTPWTRTSLESSWLSTSLETHNAMSRLLVSGSR